ncbi:MAG TPA: tetratricopeptide repeat protein [Terracidiphilus sp.]|jgi:tetratricopeptide (TPR) repeat protein|nr:tetratricopeptide repeat protein [Terracidiphilus sp.]
MAPAQQDQRQLAIALEQQGKTAEAEAAWRAQSEQHPADPEPLAHLGQLEARQQRYPDAIRDYRKAMAIAPTMPGLRPNLGLSYFKNGDYKQAIEMFSPLLKAQPGDYRLSLLMGMSHYGLGQYAAATPFLKQAATGDPQNLTLLLTLAHSCLFAREYPCVLDTFHKIVALNAESAEADMLVGEALDEMKDPVGAQREFRAAIAVNPKEPDVHFGLGYLLWTKGQYGEAAHEFQAELNNDPQHLQAMLYLADSDIQLQNSEDAKALLEKLVRLLPNDAMAHRDLGIVYADGGNNQDAAAQFEDSIRLAPSDVNAHYRLARLYRATGRTAEANIEFGKAKTLNKAADDHLLKVMSKIPARTTTPAPATDSPQK